MFWSKFVNFTLPFSNFVCSRTFVSLINNRWRKRGTGWYETLASWQFPDNLAGARVLKVGATMNKLRRNETFVQKR